MDYVFNPNKEEHNSQGKLREFLHPAVTVQLAESQHITGRRYGRPSRDRLLWFMSAFKQALRLIPILNLLLLAFCAAFPM
jgi:hypothetical protein